MQRDSIVIKLRRAAIESDIAAFRHAVARVICITFVNIRLIARHKRAEDAFLRITAEQRILCRSVDLHGIAVDRCIRRKIFTIDDRSILRRQGEGCGGDGDLHAARLCHMVGRRDVVVDGAAVRYVAHAADLAAAACDGAVRIERRRGKLPGNCLIVDGNSRFDNAAVDRIAAARLQRMFHAVICARNVCIDLNFQRRRFDGQFA